MRVRLLACAAIVALVAAACGSDDATTITEPVTTDAVDAAVPDATQQEPSGTADQSESPTAPEAAPDAEPAASGDTASSRAPEDTTANDSAVGDGAADAGTAMAPVDPGDVPDFEMINIQTGAAVNLQSVVDGSTPLLFWFWAPH